MDRGDQREGQTEDGWRPHPLQVVGQLLRAPPHHLRLERHPVGVHLASFAFSQRHQRRSRKREETTIRVFSSSSPSAGCPPSRSGALAATAQPNVSEGENRITANCRRKALLPQSHRLFVSVRLQSHRRRNQRSGRRTGEDPRWLPFVFLPLSLFL